MYAQAQAAYNTNNTETLSSRAVEYRVFSQITARLESCKHHDDALQTKFNQALSDNILLWNALSADVATETNPLPQNLKAQIFYLAQFMRHHTALVRDNKATVDAMVDINKMMMSGLSVSFAQNNTPESAPQSLAIGV